MMVILKISTMAPHPPSGPSPVGSNGRRRNLFAFSRAFSREKVAEGRMRGHGTDIMMIEN